MRGRWVLTSPLLLLVAIVAPALALAILLVLSGLALTVLALVVARPSVRRRPPQNPPSCHGDADAG